MKKLQEFKKKIDREIAKYLDRAIAETEPQDKVMASALRYVKKMILASGKRIRPALMFYGYLAAGGRDKKRILQTAVSLELIHIFLLIHDDIIDKGDKRHGVDTVHVEFEKIGRKLYPRKDAGHFGNSMAIIIGDMLSALGNQIIAGSGFENQRVAKALSELQSIISLTLVGEAKDVLIEHKGKASEKEVMEVYEFKTARYTFEGPLHLGTILAGGSEKLLKVMTDYSIPLGIAFQIQDDILGVFGAEKKMGKSSSSDIEEGKQTILVAKALEKGSGKQKKRLLEILGKKNLSAGEIREFQKIISETGSLEYAREMSKRLIAKSQQALSGAAMPSETKSFLSELADHLENREV